MADATRPEGDPLDAVRDQAASCRRVLDRVADELMCASVVHQDLHARARVLVAGHGVGGDWHDVAGVLDLGDLVLADEALVAILAMAEDALGC